MKKLTIWNYYSTNDGLTKSRRRKRVGRVAGKSETHTGFWYGNLKETDLFQDLDSDGRIEMDLKMVEGE